MFSLGGLFYQDASVDSFRSEIRNGDVWMDGLQGEMQREVVTHESNEGSSWQFWGSNSTSSSFSYSEGSSSYSSGYSDSGYSDGSGNGY